MNHPSLPMATATSSIAVVQLSRSPRPRKLSERPDHSDFKGMEGPTCLQLAAPLF